MKRGMYMVASKTKKKSAYDVRIMLNIPPPNLIKVGREVRRNDLGLSERGFTPYHSASFQRTDGCLIRQERANVETLHLLDVLDAGVLAAGRSRPTQERKR